MNPNPEYVFTDDPSSIDVDELWRLLTATYWAAGRTRLAVERSLRTSLCFAALAGDPRRISAFVRVVSDRSTFSWICDVVVAPEHRGQGLAKRLLASALAHPDVAPTMCILATRNAHGLYEKFGFLRREMMSRPGRGI